MNRVRPPLVVLLLIVTVPGNAASLNTADIVQKTAAATFACTKWRAVGLCFWLRCSLIGCSVQTSLKVGHYTPDLVVSSYNGLGESPWMEMRRALHAAQTGAIGELLHELSGMLPGSAGNRTEGTSTLDHKNLIFREAEAIGHPLLDSALAFLPPSLRCQSQAQRFLPYFLSAVDAVSWRISLPESVYSASLIPGLREIGDWPLMTWGGVYPRTGWSIQAEEPKAAAITAQRVGDIVTRIDQPHLYISLSASATTRPNSWPPGPLVENDIASGVWQMLTPVTDSTCAVFGIDDRIDSWANGRVDSEGDYSWNLWRPYQCCQRNGQWFLGDVSWMDYPL